jgi:hypothetical protein
VGDVESILSGSYSSTMTYRNIINTKIWIRLNSLVQVSVSICHVNHTFPWVHVDPIYNYAIEIHE